MSTELEQSLQCAMQLAVQRHQSGDLDAAEALYRKVLSVAPQTLNALLNLAAVFLARGETKEALRFLDHGLQFASHDPHFRYVRAVALQNDGQLAAAIEDYRITLAAQPDNVKAIENLGVALQDLGAFAQAEQAYRQALQRQPDSKIAWCNLVAVLRAQGEVERGLEAVGEALTHLPADPDLQMLRGTSQLSLGRWQEGWLGYESRYLSADQLRDKPPRMIPLPKWDGSSLQGRRILIYGEQGVGDEIMFASCIGELVAVARQVVLEADHRLLPLFQRSFPDIEVLPRQAQRPAEIDLACFDWRLSSASLPRFLRADEASFVTSRAGGYLCAAAEQVAHYRQRLASLPGALKVGISWRGGSDARARTARSIPLEAWRPLLATDVCVVSLQYGDHQQEIDTFNAAGTEQLQQIDDLDPQHDLDRLAALISALDLVISIDNSTVHLAGALARPTWVLLPRLADFRWQQGREDSPWYSSVRLFRRSAAGADDWHDLIQRVASELSRPDSLPRPSEPEQLASPAVALSQASAAAKPVQATARVLFLNDTSYWYHWGCTCTSLAIQQELRDRGYALDSLPIQRTAQLSPLPGSLDGFDDDGLWRHFSAQHPDIELALNSAETVVINGEGTLHGLQPAAVGLLYLAYVAATRLKKKGAADQSFGLPEFQRRPAGRGSATGLHQGLSCAGFCRRS